MDVRVLAYFLTVAQEENVTRAAMLLHVTQPTLSRQIKQLEDEVGAQLFRRGKHSVHLTEAGMSFRRRAQEIVDLAERAKVELACAEDEVAGEVFIGCSESQGMQELGRIISSFSAVHPGVSFTLRSGNNNDVLEWLDRGLVDVGLLTEPVNVEHFSYMRLHDKDEWGVLVRDDSPIAKISGAQPKDLAGVPLITVMDETIHTELGSWSGELARQMIPFAHYNLVTNAAALVRENLGMAVCARPRAAFDGLTFVPFEPPLRLGALLAWKESQTLSKASRAFVKSIRE